VHACARAQARLRTYVRTHPWKSGWLGRGMHQQSMGGDAGEACMAGIGMADLGCAVVHPAKLLWQYRQAFLVTPPPPPWPCKPTLFIACALCMGAYLPRAGHQKGRQAPRPRQHTFASLLIPCSTHPALCCIPKENPLQQPGAFTCSPCACVLPARILSPIHSPPYA